MTKIFIKPLALVACTAMAVALATPAYPASSLSGKDVRLVKAGDAYSRTSVNTAVFRGSSVISHGDSQYISYYDKDGYVVLGKRDISDKEWQLHRTQYKG
ncbi:MAG: BNR repeat-containing protein, partial [Muribaculaceae bacterium]|nr:BNR repeat-containing protein [Muribaculaceae bacterium]